jgi:hypothetical protein
MKYLLSIILAAMIAAPAVAKEKEGVTYDAKLTRLIDGSLSTSATQT